MIDTNLLAHQALVKLLVDNGTITMEAYVGSVRSVVREKTHNKEGSAELYIGQILQPAEPTT